MMTSMRQSGTKGIRRGPQNKDLHFLIDSFQRISLTEKIILVLVIHID